MNRVRNHELALLAAFLAFGGAVFGSYYFLAERLASPNSIIHRFARSDRTLHRTAPAAAVDGRLRLPRDQAVAFERAQLHYRGITATGRLRIDVVFPALDPERVYPYLIPIPEAETGFMLAGRRCVLVDASQRKLLIRY